MNNDDFNIKININLEKLGDLVDKLDFYANVKSILTPIFGMFVIFSSALWWYDKPNIASFLSAASAVMAFILLYSSINVIYYIKQIGKLQ